MSVLDKRIVYVNDDGVLAIVIPANANKTIEELKAKSVPDGKTSYIVDKSVIPSDRSFRNAWTYTE
jgi:hypothetical protein